MRSRPVAAPSAPLAAPARTVAPVPPDNPPPPFSGPDIECVKCGNEGASSTLVRSSGREWLSRRCRECGYVWSERTLDHTAAGWINRTMVR